MFESSQVVVDDTPYEKRFVQKQQRILFNNRYNIPKDKIALESAIKGLCLVGRPEET